MRFGVDGMVDLHCNSYHFMALRNAISEEIMKLVSTLVAISALISGVFAVAAETPEAVTNPAIALANGAAISSR